MYPPQFVGFYFTANLFCCQCVPPRIGRCCSLLLSPFSSALPRRSSSPTSHAITDRTPFTFKFSTSQYCMAILFDTRKAIEVSWSVFGGVLVRRISVLPLSLSEGTGFHSTRTHWRKLGRRCRGSGPVRFSWRQNRACRRRRMQILVTEKAKSHWQRWACLDQEIYHSQTRRREGKGTV